MQKAVDRFIPIDGELENFRITLEELEEFVFIYGIDRNVSAEGLRSMSVESKAVLNFSPYFQTIYPAES